MGKKIRRLSCIFWREDQDNLRDAGMRGEWTQRAEHHGYPANELILLGNMTPEPLPTTSGQD